MSHVNQPTDPAAYGTESTTNANGTRRLEIVDTGSVKAPRNLSMFTGQRSCK